VVVLSGICWKFLIMHKTWRSSVSDECQQIVATP
jgi:hypothetical protein